jgi:folate-binding protein YgfZ
MFSPERYTAAREGAVVHDRIQRGTLLLKGADRLGYLQGLLTNDVGSLAAGTGCYAALLTPQGRMIADIRVLERGDSLLLDVPAEVAARVAAQLSDFVITEDVTVQDLSGALAHLVVIGGASPRALGVEPLRPFENRSSRIAGFDVIVAGNDEFGVPAIDVFVEAVRKDALLAALREAGVSSVDDEVAEVLRIEAGTPRFGQDMDHDTIPLEAGIEDRAISLTKGCYVGQEIIIRVLHRGQGRVARKLVGLTFEPAARLPAPGEPLYAGDRTIGAVTSAAWSPALGRPLALGYVHRDFTAPGTGVSAGETRQAATVTALPFAVPATR